VERFDRQDFTPDFDIADATALFMEDCGAVWGAEPLPPAVPSDPKVSDLIRCGPYLLQSVANVFWTEGVE
jgi:hypothetical protein